MNTDTGNFDASELSSRKLWQLVTTETEEQVSADQLGAAQLGAAQLSAAQLREAIEELAARRHYLDELQRLGKLGSLPQDS